MVKKTKDIKAYLNSIGKTENLHLFVGATDNFIENNSNDSTIDLWKNSIFSKRIARNDVVGVIPNLKWTSGNIYYPWSAISSSNDKFYTWNNQNGNVYLCISNNAFNRKDLSGNFTSTYIPNHAYGIQKYPDGYSWLPIYRITGDYLRFVKTNWIPVISFEDFNLASFSTEELTIQNFCNSNLDTNGYCSLYFTDNYSVAAPGSTYDQYLKGELYKTVEAECSECFYMFDGNTKFKSVFSGSTSDIEPSIQILDKFDEIGQLISQNRIPSSSAFYALYDIANNGPDDGAVISANIDLSEIESTDLIVNVSNPEFTVTSNTGSGARIRLTTYNNIDGKYIINGIEIISNGANYKDIVLDISSSIFESDIKTQLLNSIEINLDIIDGLNVDPYDVLECKNFMIDGRLDIQELAQTQVDFPSEINLYGLVSNPLEITSTGDYIISGSELPPNGNKIQSLITEMRVVNELDIGGGSVSAIVAEGPLFTSATEVSTFQKTTAKNIKSATNSKYQITLANESVVSIIGGEYSTVANTNYIIDSEGEKFIVGGIIKSPKLRQYSGKVLQTTKTAAPIKLTDSQGELSKIIRINIVRGL
jgi:hypothetical protein